MKTLRLLRILAALASVTLLTLLFLDFTGTLHAYLGWLARIQLLPALLAVNTGIIAALLVLTLLFGRVYCSVICPLGIFQDAVAWASKKLAKRRYNHTPALNGLRYTLLGLFLLAFLAGAAPFFALLEPYGAYGRMASNLFAPIYQEGNNLLSFFAKRANSYAFYDADVWIKSTATFAVALVSFAVIGFLAWRNGRTYCNAVCPVGTALGLLSRFAWLRPAVDTSKCNGCRLCERRCKASCIDAKAHQIDHSRCVACLNCVTACPQGAMRFSSTRAGTQTHPVHS